MKIHNLEILHGDCMDYMKTCEDNAFDLAIVDPPYTNDTKNLDNYLNKMRKHGYELKTLNYAPDENYFNELFRVSENQIIWGGNYFSSIWSRGGRGFVFWYKENPVKNFADGELAWTSFDQNARCIHRKHFGAHGKDKEGSIHPTQKPVALYEWLLTNYAKPDQRILDTHLGSGSSAIAAHYFGCEFVGIELDEDYFNAAVNRIHDQTKQLDLLA